MTHSALQRLRFLCAAAAALAAVGCGGGGETPAPSPAPSPAPAPAPTTAAVQGLWQGTWTTATSQLSASAAVLPDGRAWVVGTDANGAVRLVKTEFAVQGNAYAGSGLQHVPGVAGTTPTTASATVTAGSTLQGTFTVGGVAQSFALNYVSRYDTAAVMADFAAAWTGSLAGGSVTATWNITQAGVVTGSSTTGCSYGGLLQTRSEAKAIVDAVVNETCAGTTTLLTGVATLNEAKTRLSVTTTTAGETAAVLLSLQR